jgi:hypothetical protein
MITEHCYVYLCCFMSYCRRGTGSNEFREHHHIIDSFSSLSSLVVSVDYAHIIIISMRVWVRVSTPRSCCSVTIQAVCRHASQ